jgi:hypothetical protein
LAGVATATGKGLTNTVAVEGFPGQPLAVAVIEKVTVTGFAVLFINVPEILPLPLFRMVPVTAGLSLVHVKPAPATPLVEEIVMMFSAEQIV